MVTMTRERWRSLLLTDPAFKAETDGQLTIFYDTSEEPPDPDNFPAHDFYESAYQNWAKKHPTLHQALVWRNQQEKSYARKPDCRGHCSLSACPDSSSHP